MLRLRITFLLLLGCLAGGELLAQEVPPPQETPAKDTTLLGRPRARPLSADTTATRTPTEKPASAESAEPKVAGSIQLGRDTTRQKGDIQTTIDYSAADSMNFNIFSQTMYLYGDAKVTYGDQEITAAIIELNQIRKTVKAYGVVDSTGALLGLPVFKDGESTYNAEEITYNYKTRKGIINRIITEQNEGFIQGERVKKTPTNEMYIANALYTTCNLADPHFGIRSRQLKLVPGKYVISGPFNMELNRVPTPLGFALGLFPFTDKRTSGVVMPVYGESVDRGFFLRDGGVYLAVNDYIGMKLLGEIYSLGGWGATMDMNYRKRYGYNGSLNVSYRNVQRQEADLTTSTTTDYWVRWNHSPESKGNSRFSASVNAGSSSFNRNNSMSVTDFLAPTFNSNISYSKTFEGTPFSFNSSLRHNQNTLTNIVTINPEASLAMNRIFPFEKLSTKKNMLTQLSVGYNSSLRSKVTNDPNDAGLRFPFPVVGAPAPSTTQLDTLDFFREFGSIIGNTRYGMSHTVPISTNLTVLKHFQLTPAINYQEEWYPNRFNYTWVDSLQAVAVDTISQLSRSYQYNLSSAVTTRLYAFYYFKGGMAVRQMITPSLSFSYQPDFGDPRFGFYQQVQTSENGTSKAVPIFQGGPVPPIGRSSSMSFGFDNQLEAKVRVRRDTAVEEIKMPILQNASIRSSYNFAADSFQLANFALSARTVILKKLNINISGTVDPYAYQPASINPETGVASALQRRTPVFAWQQGQGMGRLTNATLNLTTNLSPEDFKIKRKRITPAGIVEEGEEGESGVETPVVPNGNVPTVLDESQLNELERQELQQMRMFPQRYVDFNIPWSLNLNYSLNYTKSPVGQTSIVQTLNFSGEIKITQKWKVSANSGYDFEKKEFAFTTFNIFRDLHCWQMALSWVPFGQRQSYNIDISVKASILQDLKLSKRNSWFDR